MTERSHGTRVTRATAAKVDAMWREKMRPILVERENNNARRTHYRALQRAGGRAGGNAEQRPA